MIALLHIDTAACALHYKFLLRAEIFLRIATLSSSSPGEAQLQHAQLEQRRG